MWTRRSNYSVHREDGLVGGMGAYLMIEKRERRGEKKRKKKIC